MSAWLDPVARVLAGAAPPVRIFCRDDDGGWNDDALLALVRVHARRGIPLDVATIPAAATPALAARLAPFRESLVGIHQHGCEHANHESAGRKCEFGPARDAHARRADLVRGRALLAATFGADVDPVFTPPWNRCTPDTADALADLGFRALSRDVTATPSYARPGLVELPVAVDWLKFRRGAAPDLTALGQRLAAAIEAAGPRSEPAACDDVVGIMFHHAVMNAADLQAVDELLALFAASRRAACVRMRDLLPHVAATRIASTEDCAA